MSQLAESGFQLLDALECPLADLGRGQQVGAVLNQRLVGHAWMVGAGKRAAAGTQEAAAHLHQCPAGFRSMCRPRASQIISISALPAELITSTCLTLSVVLSRVTASVMLGMNSMPRRCWAQNSRTLSGFRSLA